MNLKSLIFKFQNSIWFYIIASTVILSWPLFYNGYPLLYSDSGTYIVSSINSIPPIDRPIGYGLFINWVTWKSTLFTVPLFQNLILSFLIVRCCEVFSLQRFYAIALTIVLSIGTGISWYSNQIMPDIFTSILFVSVILYLTDDSAKKINKILYLLFIFIALICHFSHLLILIATLGLVFIGFKKYLFQKKRKLLFIGLLCIAAPLFLAIYHYKHGFGFIVSRSSNVFLTARLSESGILKKILDKKCLEKEYSLCACKDSLPNATAPFLWDYENSPLYKRSGGWEKANIEYADFVKQIYSDREIFFFFLKESIKATAQQIIEVNVGSGLSPYGENSAPYYPISVHFKKEYNNYINAKQQQIWFNFENENVFFNVVNIVGLCLLIFSFYAFRKNKIALFVISSCIIFCICNAAVTASLANVYDRLQARVMWLPAFFALFFFIQLLQRNRRSKNNSSGS